MTISKVTLTNGHAAAPYDQERAERAVRELLLALGEDPDREGLKETPARVAKAMKENFAGLWQAPEDVLTTTFDIGHEELVIVRDIEVFSHCEHHLTPFHGVAHIGYIPRGKITGLSKLARLVDVYAKRPQVQERLTTQIADALVEIRASSNAFSWRCTYWLHPSWENNGTIKVSALSRCLCQTPASTRTPDYSDRRCLSRNP